LRANHAKHYVYGILHTDCTEDFWALLKRGMIGVYRKVGERIFEST